MRSFYLLKTCYQSQKTSASSVHANIKTSQNGAVADVLALRKVPHALTNVGAEKFAVMSRLLLVHPKGSNHPRSLAELGIELFNIDCFSSVTERLFYSDCIIELSFGMTTVMLCTYLKSIMSTN